MRQKKLLCFCIAAILLLGGCQRAGKGGLAPAELVFTPVAQTADGKDMFYLFDDNPEHLNSRFLADGAEPSSIAHFADLKPGVYTVFSYHHRGDSVARDADLFFDAAFYTDSTASFRINRIGLDHDWQWNQAWADFTGVNVWMPEYYKTFNCVCPAGTCGCSGAEQECPRAEEGCACIIRDELVVSDAGKFDNLGVTETLQADREILLSEFISNIGRQEINKYRYMGYDEPTWLIMEFEVLSGTMTFDTLAYTDKEAARANLRTMRHGAFDPEPQYKGIADNAPIVKAELSYCITDAVPSGGLPIIIKNQRFPEGTVAEDGRFSTNVNTWNTGELVEAEAAESDMMQLTYVDSSKLDLYGEAVQERDDIWRFDPYHTKLYQEPDDPEFVPNAEMSAVDYPKGQEQTTTEFYNTYVCNLGNFGVRYLYTIHLENQGQTERTVSFRMKSISGQVYRFSFQAADGQTVRDDGGQYYMKRFDMDPAEDPNSDTEPKERLEPAKYSTEEAFVLEPGGAYILEFEIVTLTGCKAPIENQLYLQ